jgi:hypothetical protein
MLNVVAFCYVILFRNLERQGKEGKRSIVSGYALSAVSVRPENQLVSGRF